MMTKTYEIDLKRLSKCPNHNYLFPLPNICVLCTLYYLLITKHYDYFWRKKEKQQGEKVGGPGRKRERGRKRKGRNESTT